jgi:ATP-dependent RNA helicase RhlE
LQNFEELGLKPEILRAIKEKGYAVPMPIQAQAIPVVMTGQDIIGCAQTGTGKTASFVLPILHQMTRKERPQAVILVPTRELAIQIGDNVRQYGKHLPFTSMTIYGGVDMVPQIKGLRKGVDIIVATPGRLLDHIRRKNVSLHTVKYLVLDEADRMLDMGFIQDIETIISLTAIDRQTLLFSATMPPEVRQLAGRYMQNAARINAAPPATIAAGITHRVYPVPHSLKKDLLVDLLQKEPVVSALIFTKTRRGADVLAAYLEEKNLSVARLHSECTQRHRQRAIQGFRAGKYKILVATDIAARGLDIPQVSHVFNFNLPECVDDYIHRAGRTARADGTGFAFCLMSPEEIDLYNALELRLGREALAWTSHPGFDYLSEPPQRPEAREHHARGGRNSSGRRRNGSFSGAPSRSGSARRRAAFASFRSDPAPRPEENTTGATSRPFYGRNTRTRRPSRRTV